MVLWGIVAGGQPMFRQEEAGRQGGGREGEERRWAEGEERVEGRMIDDEGADGGVGLVVELSTKEGRALDPSKPS